MNGSDEVLFRESRQTCRDNKWSDEEDIINSRCSVCPPEADKRRINFSTDTIFSIYSLVPHLFAIQLFLPAPQHVAAGFYLLR
jgi:hypothetical protein